jgi:hypothetical protein
MGLSKSENEFVIFREFRSALWFIRKSSDIQRDGFFVQLNGFEAQIFMDISSVHDDETGKYAVLCAALGGSGTRDIDEALQEIFLKDLLRAFDAVSSKEYIESIKSLTLKKGAPGVKHVFDALSPAALEWFAQLENFIGGNYGARTVIDTKKRGVVPTGKLIFVRLQSRLKRLVKLWSMTEEAAERKKKTGSSVVSVFTATGKADESLPMFEFLALWCLLSCVRDVAGSKCKTEQARGLVELWALDRRLAKALLRICPERGLSEDAARFYAKLALEALPLSAANFMPNSTAKKTAAKKPVAVHATRVIRKHPLKPAARKIAEHFLRSKNAALCGVNMYNNVLWFNKDSYESAVLFTILLHSFFAHKASLEETKSLFLLLWESKEKSGYQVEKLLDPADGILCTA